jgi:hypothetical protein
VDGACTALISSMLWFGSLVAVFFWYFRFLFLMILVRPCSNISESCGSFLVSTSTASCVCVWYLRWPWWRLGWPDDTWVVSTALRVVVKSQVLTALILYWKLRIAKMKCKMLFEYFFLLLFTVVLHAFI